MRIISGQYKHRLIQPPSNFKARPTTDLAKESLFNILENTIDFEQIKVLDLFGGTGALALEAMSRGAESAVIADVSVSAVKCINSNIQAVMGERPGVKCLKADYRTALNSLKGEKFDLIFLDPPYRLTEAYALSARFLMENGMLTRDAVIVAERDKDVFIDWPKGLTVRDSRLYRDTAIDFVIPEDDP